MKKLIMNNNNNKKIMPTQIQKKKKIIQTIITKNGIRKTSIKTIAQQNKKIGIIQLLKTLSPPKRI